MDDLTTRFWAELVGRTTGPMMFRFILQPLMAMFYAYRDGLLDARSGRPPYCLRFSPSLPNEPNCLRMESSPCRA